MHLYESWEENDLAHINLQDLLVTGWGSPTEWTPRTNSSLPSTLNTSSETRVIMRIDNTTYAESVSFTYITNIRIQVTRMKQVNISKETSESTNIRPLHNNVEPVPIPAKYLISI